MEGIGEAVVAGPRVETTGLVEQVSVRPVDLAAVYRTAVACAFGRRETPFGEEQTRISQQNNEYLAHRSIVQYAGDVDHGSARRFLWWISAPWASNSSRTSGGPDGLRRATHNGELP